MKIAYLIDRESLGGGCEYIHRKSSERRRMNDECRIFYSSRTECTPRAVDDWGADEIVVNHLKALVQLMGNPFRRPKGRVTFVVHGIHLRKYDWRRGFNARLLKLCRRCLEATLYHRCDRLIALTETDKADILKLYGRSLKVEVEPNTLDGWVPKLSETLPSGIDGTFRYICIGRFDYPKGQDRLIRALSDSLSFAPSRTLFIGDGPTLESCKALAVELGVADLCVFAGALPDADRYLKCADSVVSPSRWEGMPYLLMKARALGCQILATDCPGNRDVLTGYDKWEKLVLR